MAQINSGIRPMAYIYRCFQPWKHLLHLTLAAFLVAPLSGCGNEDHIDAEEAKSIAARLKESSPKTTDSVRIDDYIILGKKDIGIRATLLSWNSQSTIKNELMDALAYQNAKTFACGDKVIREMLADGFELTVMYTSADRKGELFATVHDESCRK